MVFKKTQGCGKDPISLSDNCDGPRGRAHKGPSRDGKEYVPIRTGRPLTIYCSCKRFNFPRETPCSFQPRLIDLLTLKGNCPWRDRKNVSAEKHRELIQDNRFLLPAAQSHKVSWLFLSASITRPGIIRKTVSKQGFCLLYINCIGHLKDNRLEKREKTGMYVESRKESLEKLPLRVTIKRVKCKYIYFQTYV